MTEMKWWRAQSLHVNNRVVSHSLPHDPSKLLIPLIRMSLCPPIPSVSQFMSGSNYNFIKANELAVAKLQLTAVICFHMSALMMWGHPERSVNDKTMKYPGNAEPSGEELIYSSVTGRTLGVRHQTTPKTCSGLWNWRCVDVWLKSG